MQRSKNTSFKILSFVVLFLFLNIVAVKPAFAKDPCSKEGGHWLNIRPARCTFQSIGESFGDNVIKTITNSTVSIITETPTKILTNRSSEEMHLCEIVFMMEAKNLNPNSKEDIETMITDEDQVDEVLNADCSDLNYNLVALDMGYPQAVPTTNRSSGGVATGIYSLVARPIYEEDVPANLAYYTKHMASKIPIVKDTAFAATAGPYDEASILWPVVMRVWEVSKNIAYGLLALFMLYIGIMIMMRKQTDPRTTVTIQNALPKIVIAVILITFSYAIGALGAELIKGLSQLAYRPLTGEISGIQNRPGVFQTWWTVASGAVKGTGVAGILTTLLMVIVGVLMIVITIISLIKALIAYIKIVLSIWVAPIIFAWGAIPGNEDSTIGWFKNLAVNVLTVPALKLGIALSMYVGWIMIEQAEAIEEASGIDGQWIIGPVGAASVFSRISTAVFIIVLLFWTLKIPNKLEKAILDKKK